MEYVSVRFFFFFESAAFLGALADFFDGVLAILLCLLVCCESFLTHFALRKFCRRNCASEAQRANTMLLMGSP